MPKAKTHSATKKRVRVNSKGTIKRGSANCRHRLLTKTKRQKSAFNSSTYVSKADENSVKKLLPYS
ncbi:MAG: 50S ribosomal protein L35 [Clostridia bacterium]|nr:50S ribosomal protein L35 [Clostridia bacterium]